MKRHLTSIVILLLLLACIAGYWYTRDTDHPAQKRAATPDSSILVDDHLLQTARQLAATADQSEEQTLAREALRLADNEMDQAYASALREATTPGPPPKGKVKQALDRVNEIKARIKAAQPEIDKLSKAAEKDDDAAEKLELAKAQVALNQDELAAAQEMLMAVGGDRHAKLERAMKLRQRAVQEVQFQKLNTEAEPTSLLSQIAAWVSLNNHNGLIAAARQQAANRAASLSREHDALDALMNKRSAPVASALQQGDDEEDAEAMMARLQQLSDGRKTQAEITKRMIDVQQLADVYKRWSALLDSAQRRLMHLILRQFAIILIIVLGGIAAVEGLRQTFARSSDPRNVRQLRVISIVAVQIVCGVLIVLVCFGMPNQTSTLIGITTAGLTVVLKDFIVAFFGWFVIIGKNGVHIGDWVEIEGVGGEVIEIGILKTVLLEMGNWTNSGHPTGRRVSFNNKYAIEQHYFNFSTTSQWQWDELSVMLPSGVNPYRRAQEIRQRVEDITAPDAVRAEQDWLRVTQQYNTRSFSAKPSLDMKPSLNGIEASVRYITRAPARAEMKSRLFASMVDLLHGPDEENTTAN